MGGDAKAHPDPRPHSRRSSHAQSTVGLLLGSCRQRHKQGREQAEARQGDFKGAQRTPLTLNASGSTKAIQRAALTLEPVHDVHGRDGLAVGVLRVGDRVADHVLEECLETTADFLIDKARDALDTSTASEAAHGGLGDALDVIAKHDAVALGAAFTETFATFAATCSPRVQWQQRAQRLQQLHRLRRRGSLGFSLGIGFFEQLLRQWRQWVFGVKMDRHCQMGRRLAVVRPVIQMTQAEAVVMCKLEFANLLGLIGRDEALGAMDIQENLVVAGHGSFVVLLEERLLRLHFELLRRHDIARQFIDDHRRLDGE